MLSRHSNELMSRLEQVVDIGCTTIRKRELLIWFGQERMTVNIWRDIHEKWTEILENTGETINTPLLVGDAEGIWTFAWGEGLMVTKDSWFREVREYTREKKTADTNKADPTVANATH